MDAGDWARYGLARERLLDVTDGIRHLSENERRKSPRSSRQYPRLRDAILAYVQAFYELIPTARNYLTEAATTDAILQVVWCIWECNLPRLECPEEAVFAHTVLWRRPEVSLLQRVEDVRDAVRTIDRWLSDSSATATECRRGRGGPKPKYDPRADAQIARDWESAKSQHSRKVEFAKSRGLAVKSLDQLLARVRKRTRCAASSKSPAVGS